MKKFKLKKGDNVTVISGKDKGKSGEIIEVLKSIDKVKVRGVNILKKHKKEKIRLTVSSGSKVWFRSIYEWKIISKL